MKALRRLSLLITATAFLVGAFGALPIWAESNPYEGPRIAVIGCSNTRYFLNDYAQYSTTDNVWYQNLAVGGGHLAAWADISGEGVVYWAGFQSHLETYGAHAVWIQMCIREPWTSAAGMTSTQQGLITTVINHARALTSSTIDVYVSPINTYEVHSCAAIGPYGVANSVELADWAAASGLALRGPDIGPLTPSMVAPDGCHPKGPGRHLGGQQIAAFFDQVDTAPDPEPAYWCVDGSVVALSDGSTPDGTYVAGPFSTSSEAEADPGCVPPPPPAYWCVDGSVVTVTDGSTPTGTYVAGPFGTDAEAAADPGCAPTPPTTYWCVDGSVLTVNNGTPPNGNYVSGPFAAASQAAADPGCITPRISTSTNPIYVGQPVIFTDWYTGGHRRRWNMGNGVAFNNNSRSQVHTFSTTGTFTVSVETKDSAGNRVTLTRVISVIAP